MECGDRETLIKDVLQFIEIMPLLKKRVTKFTRNHPVWSSWTGKTMMAKSLASEANITTILISAEMIQSRSEIKRVFELGENSPTLVIIEDIDTAGTGRKFTTIRYWVNICNHWME